MLQGMWDIPRSGIEPVSPALAGRFLSTGSPEKSSFSLFLLFSLSSNQELKARKVNFEAGVSRTEPKEREVCGDHLFPPPLTLTVDLCLLHLALTGHSETLKLTSETFLQSSLSGTPGLYLKAPESWRKAIMPELF